VLEAPGMKTLASLALVPLALFLSACSSSTEIGTTPYQLTFSKTGGLLGVNEVTVIDSAARTISHQSLQGSGTPAPPQQATLTQAEVDRITTAIEQADLEHAGGPYHCTGCADQQGYDAKLVTGGATYDASWEDYSDASLEAMGHAIAALIDEKFSSTGP
jgi:hypothetical protein